MRYMRFYEDLFVAGDVFLTNHCHKANADFEDYTVKTHRGHYLDRIELFRFRKESFVKIAVSYYDDDLNHHRRESYIPYENYKDEMLAFYDATVNG